MDLQRVSDYLKEHHPSYRQPTIRKVHAALQALKQWPHRGRVAVGMQDRLIIDDTLALELFEELADVGADFGGVGLGELSLEFSYDFAEGALTVTAFEHLASRALKVDRPFRK
jgi:hypothetical protein